MPATEGYWCRAGWSGDGAWMRRAEVTGLDSGWFVEGEGTRCFIHRSKAPEAVSPSKFAGDTASGALLL
eukprot:338914-Alexandrium_andersonii.AAC.1